MSSGTHGDRALPGGDLPRVFLSYTEADEAWAEWIAWQLRETGTYHPRLQAWHAVPGQNFVRWIVGPRGARR